MLFMELVCERKNVAQFHVLEWNRNREIPIENHIKKVNRNDPKKVKPYYYKGMQAIIIISRHIYLLIWHVPIK